MTSRDARRLPLRSRGVLPALAGAAAAGLAGCSSPPAAEEPTGEDADQAWTIAAGSHGLDRTVAHIYSLALNSRDTPAVVEVREESSAALAAGLGRQGNQEDGEDPGYDMTLARTLSVVEQLESEQEDDAQEGDRDAGGPVPESEELVARISAELGQAELLEPTAATFSSALVITSVTAQEHEIDLSAEADDPAFAAACDELELGIREDLPDPREQLEELYGCEPVEITAGTEEELLEQVITAELDAAIITASHPGITDHALVALTDAERAFPQEQYLPVVSGQAAGAEELPDVTEELAERLDDEALTTLRRLIDGEDALDPEEAAEYWLVEEELIAEPEDWG